MSRAPGALAIVLHTHMPYVEGFGTWPFGEEWLWEAVARCYLPLLDALDAVPGRITLSVTPVLADQLEAPGALDRCEAFLRDVRPETHRLDIAAAREPGEVAALEHSAAQYERAAAALARGEGAATAGSEGGGKTGSEGGAKTGSEGGGKTAIEGAVESRGHGLAARLAAHATWTSAATHAVLPLLATAGGVRLQLATGIAAHRARAGGWGGGFWLPECAHAPWLDPLLEEAGVHAVCVDLTDVPGVAPLRPLRSPAGPLLVPIDRSLVELVWSDAGYPSRGAYRDTFRLTERRHEAWAVDGPVYDPARAAAQARADARDFAGRAAARVRDGGLAVVALDTELLGLHWHEGVAWLTALLEAAADAGLRIAPLDELLREHEPAPAPELPVTSWGRPRDLSTWSGPHAGGLAWRQRAAELRAVAALPGVPDRALRELLALQSSDWAFLIARASAGRYPEERVAAHEAAFLAALAGELHGELRNLAPFLARAALAAP
jgi:1,4-alpha-glucan branching enzyme